jgi:integrase
MGQITRHQNRGLRKVCDCARRSWAKCPHSWNFNFKVKGGVSYRFAVDAEVGKHVEAKKDAEAYADAWRSAIRAGTFRRRTEPVTAATIVTTAALTFEQFAEKWRESRVDVSDSQRAQDCAVCNRVSAVTTSGERFGGRAIGTITEDDLERVFGELNDLAGSSWNKYRQTILHLQRWGQRKGYLTRPFVSDEAIEKGGALGRKRGARRDRRLVPDVVDDKGKVTEPGEERRLLSHASPWFHNLIIAALETGCRRGELLSLQWRDVDMTRGELRVRAENAKSREARAVPISPRLRAVLQMVRNDPDGEPHKPLAFVFGDVTGGKVESPKKAWETLVLKAHGIAPEWHEKKKLSAASRAQYAAVDLHFHDLRHEAGSRFLERGWPLHHVQAMLGHAQASTTSTYLNVTGHHLQESMRRFNSAPLQTVAQGAETAPSPLRNEIDAPAANVLVN